MALTKTQQCAQQNVPERLGELRRLPPAPIDTTPMIRQTLRTGRYCGLPTCPATYQWPADTDIAAVLGRAGLLAY